MPNTQDLRRALEGRPAARRPKAPKADTSHAAPLLAPSWELASLGLLLTAYLLFYLLVDGGGFMNVVGPIWLTVTVCLGALFIALRERAAVWSALFWFRISVATYYGVGSLVPLISDADIVEAMKQYFAYQSDDLSRLNLLFAACVLTVLAAANVLLMVLSARQKPQSVQDRHRAERTLLFAGLAFLVIGAPIRYFVVLPLQLGLLNDVNIPGAVLTAGHSVYAAIVLLTIWSRRYAKGMFPLVVALVAFDCFVGVIQYNKTAVLTPMIMFLLALLDRNVTFMRLGVAGAVLLATYFALIPVVQMGRSELQRRHSGRITGDFSERSDVLSDVFSRDDGLSASQGGSVGLQRLSYTNQAAFAMHLRDIGIQSDTLDNALAVFVPRFLWPGKPIITDVATDFNVAATGNPNSASAPGLFAEAYWNFGWLGVPILMVPLGIVLGLLSRYSIGVFARGEWFNFPAVLLAMRIGFRTDGFFVPDVIGACVIFLSLIVVLFGVGKVAGSLIGSRSTGRMRGSRMPARYYPRPR